MTRRCRSLGARWVDPALLRQPQPLQVARLLPWPSEALRTDQAPLPGRPIHTAMFAGAHPPCQPTGRPGVPPRRCTRDRTCVRPPRANGHGQPGVQVRSRVRRAVECSRSSSRRFVAPADQASPSGYAVRRPTRLWDAEVAYRLRLFPRLLPATIPNPARSGPCSARAQSCHFVPERGGSEGDPRSLSVGRTPSDHDLAKHQASAGARQALFQAGRVGAAGCVRSGDGGHFGRSRASSVLGRPGGRRDLADHAARPPGRTFQHRPPIRGGRGCRQGAMRRQGHGCPGRRLGECDLALRHTRHRRESGLRSVASWRLGLPACFQHGRTHRSEWTVRRPRHPSAWVPDRPRSLRSR